MGREAVGGPLPDVSGHVEEAVTVDRERADGRGTLEAVGGEVLPGEFALPGVGHHPAAGRELVPPYESGALEPTARRELPLGLGRQRLAGPGGVGLHVLVRHVGHGVPLAARDRTARTLGPVPAGTRHVRPPVVVIAETDTVWRPAEHEGTGHDERRVGVGIVGRVGLALGHGHVARGLDEAVKLANGHGVPVHPEPVQSHPMDRPLLGVELLRAHEERAPGNPDRLLTIHPPYLPAGGPRRRNELFRCGPGRSATIRSAGGSGNPGPRRSRVGPVAWA